MDTAFILSFVLSAGFAGIPHGNAQSNMFANNNYMMTARAVPPNCLCRAALQTVAGTFVGGRICGSDGRNYTSACHFINAQATNPNLGERPCFTPQEMKVLQQYGSDYAYDQETFCMTNGLSLRATRMQIDQQMHTDPSLALLCEDRCPCNQLKCPSRG
ncbi:hypothetical protein BV898_13838 [Hypsibius exemplaris]|uniref:Kazal-like domain-containing protein n=1 Tax=Hypsibius exemplaris TaxID=2072580 RepID=A0A1W0W9M1_HYPEX|nr:hypothetical protein BV898_13838 [Hypsibius exemplaris]